MPAAQGKGGLRGEWTRRAHNTLKRTTRNQNKNRTVFIRVDKVATAGRILPEEGQRRRPRHVVRLAVQKQQSVDLRVQARARVSPPDGLRGRRCVRQRAEPRQAARRCLCRQLRELGRQPEEAKLGGALGHAVTPPAQHVHHEIGARRAAGLRGTDAVEDGVPVFAAGVQRAAAGQRRLEPGVHGAVAQSGRGQGAAGDHEAPGALGPRRHIPEQTLGVDLVRVRKARAIAQALCLVPWLMYGFHVAELPGRCTSTVSPTTLARLTYQWVGRSSGTSSIHSGCMSWLAYRCRRPACF